MAKSKRFTTILLTLALAAGAGHIMQYGMAPTPGPATLVTQGETWTPLPTRTTSSTLLAPRRSGVPQPTIASLELSFPAAPAAVRAGVTLPSERMVRLSVPDDVSVMPPGDQEINLNGFGLACDVDAVLTPAGGAMIRLDITAPCNPGAVVDIGHADLRFRNRLDPTGGLSVDIPAMTGDAGIRIAVADAPALLRAVTVPDAAAYDRVALVWDGAAPLSIHALEFGAGPGSRGHVSAGRNAPRDEADTPLGGSVTRLGDPTLTDATLSEVYSFPSGLDARTGTVRMSVSAKVTRDTCGTAIPVAVIRTSGDAPPVSRKVTVQVPGCEAVGSILVLKNLLQDLKIARN